MSGTDIIDSPSPRLAGVTAGIVERGLAFDGPAISAFRPAITRAPNGDVLAAFNTTDDVNPGGAVDLIRLTDDGRTWGPAQVLREPTVWEDGSVHSSRGMTTLSDGTPTFVINSMRTDVNVTIDACPDGYSPSQTVAFGDHDSGVPNYQRDDGCTILDLIWQAAPFPDHSAFVNHVDQVALAFVNAGLLTDHEHGRIMRAAAHHH